MGKRLFIVFTAQVLSFGALGQTSNPQFLQAKKLLERISSTKVPADHALIPQMAERLKAGDYLGAADLATTHPNFLNTTVKLMALKMSTREETLRLEFNDFAASFVGVTRDQRDARELLNGNFYYMADATKIPAGITVRSDLKADLVKSNNHYKDLDNPVIDLGQVLIRVQGQKLVDGTDALVDNPDAAGVLTSRSFLGAHAIAGTNRRPVEFTFREFMCVPIQDWADTKASDIRVGRDIDRFPGNDHMKYQTTCKGCHTQMDSLRGAFARWDFQGDHLDYGGLANRPGGFDAKGISTKYSRNSNVFPGGYVVVDESFINNSRGPANATLFQWRGETSGKGVQGLGTMVANSKRFSQCMVKRVYDAVCRTDLNPKQNLAFLSQQADRFEQNGYNLKQLFKEVAVSQQCMGQ